MGDEDPREQRHGERLHQPVDADGGGNAAPVLPDLAQCRRVDLQQHGHDHQPDEDGDRQVDLCHGRIADRVEQAGRDLTQGDADDDTERNPKGQVALEQAERRRGGGGGGAHEDLVPGKQQADVVAGAGAQQDAPASGFRASIVAEAT